MDLVFRLLLVLHLLGMASIIGSWLATSRAPRVLPGMVHGALIQLVTGVAMVGLLESDAVDSDDADGVNNAKIAVKLTVALVVVVLAWVNRKRGDAVRPAIVHLIGGLAVLNVLVAVLWT